MWDSFAYQYIVGGFFFLLAIFLGFRKGVLKLARKTDRITFFILILGFVLYFCFHGFWILWAKSQG